MQTASSAARELSNSSRLRRAHRLNEVDGNQLKLTLKLLDRQQQHAINMVNKEVVSLGKLLEKIQVSSGSSQQHFLFDFKRLKKEGPTFVYGDRMESRKLARRESLLLHYTWLQDGSNQVLQLLGHDTQELLDLPELVEDVGTQGSDSDGAFDRLDDSSQDSLERESPFSYAIRPLSALRSGDCSRASGRESERPSSAAANNWYSWLPPGGTKSHRGLPTTEKPAASPVVVPRGPAAANRPSRASTSSGSTKEAPGYTPFASPLDPLRYSRYDPHARDQANYGNKTRAKIHRHRPSDAQSRRRSIHPRLSSQVSDRNSTTLGYGEEIEAGNTPKDDSAAAVPSWMRPIGTLCTNRRSSLSTVFVTAKESGGFCGKQPSGPLSESLPMLSSVSDRRGSLVSTVSIQQQANPRVEDSTPAMLSLLHSTMASRQRTLSSIRMGRSLKRKNLK